ncbi:MULTISPECIES: DUF5666 domain-containing protein [unclassified Mycobacterium]|uniref:DUF5666 domain-containing protein n=1 Tax=unclassified Mycobacterium TaxID=2642494 RepID=UPI0007FEA283|nr:MULTISPECIES: DUF5666 domain-containing protein [unclassified Mycobacterium]OBH03210.1 hypothetical protein A5696_08930 [Mycobacterium sp. E2699]OBI56003.1 hypothetical protein A5705_22915 [Mycobacterium sp. E787]
MSASTVKPRLAQVAIVGVIAVIALSVAMCHSDNTASNSNKPTVTALPPGPAPGTPSPPAPPPPPAPKDYVEGLVESVSGGTIQLRTRTGSATVDFSPSTRVVEVTPAQLTDVTPGSCVNVRATPQSAPTGGSITAQAVTVTSAVDGKCPPPAGFYGTVSSVSGNTIAVNGIGPQPTPTTVTVANSTSYQKQTQSDSQAITNGKCMGAQGTQDAGVLHAMTISLEACPPMGHPHHHLPHLPHLPFHL